MASPAEVLRSCLIDLNLVQLPEVPGELIPIQELPGDGLAPCYVSSMPDDPDQLVCIYDTAGMSFGRRMADGKYLNHHGVQITVRTLDFPTGSALAYLLANENGIGKLTNTTTTTPDQVVHYVKTAYRTSTVLFVGEEVNKKRLLWTIDARIAFQDSEPSLG